MDEIASIILQGTIDDTNCPSPILAQSSSNKDTPST